MTTANPLANDSGCLQLKACYLPLNFKGGLKGALPYFSVFCLIAADQIPPSNSYGGHDYTRGGRFECAPRRTFMLRTLVCLAALKFKCIAFLSFFRPCFPLLSPDFLCPLFYFYLSSLHFPVLSSMFCSPFSSSYPPTSTLFLHPLFTSSS